MSRSLQVSSRIPRLGRILTRIALLLLCFTLQNAALLTAQSINGSSPRTLVVGTESKLTITGDKLGTSNSLPQLWTSFPATIKSLPLEAPPLTKENPNWKQFSFLVTPHSGTHVGIGALRIHSALGVSKPFLIAIDELPSSSIKPAHALATAPLIKQPIAIEGQSSEFKSDFYKLTVEAGERLAFEVVAQRLGSSLDPVLHLRNEQGQELLSADDDPSLQADCRFDYVFPESGNYYLEIHDVEYRNPNVYRLRIGNFPIAPIQFPMGIRSRNEQGLQAVPRSSRFTEQPLPAATLVASSPFPQVIERTPNNTPKSATPLETPCAVNGRFNAPADVDYFQFEATEDEFITIECASRRLRSPAYLKLSVTDPEGAQVASTGGPNENDETLRLVAKKSGAYTIKAEEELNAGGLHHGYHFTVNARRIPITLELRYDKDKNNSRFISTPGGIVQFVVKAARHGYDGPISLSALLNDRILQTKNHVIAQGKEETSLQVFLPENLQLNSLLHLQVIGEATHQGTVYRSPMTTTWTLSADLPGRQPHPEKLNGFVPIHITHPVISLHPPTLALDNPFPTTLTLERFGSQDGGPKIQARWIDLPEGIETTNQFTLEENSRLIQTSLALTEQATPGDHSAILETAYFQNGHPVTTRFAIHINTTP